MSNRVRRSATTQSPKKVDCRQQSGSTVGISGGGDVAQSGSCRVVGGWLVGLVGKGSRIGKKKIDTKERISTRSICNFIAVPALLLSLTFRKLFN